jgi:hypothetical protein
MDDATRKRIERSSETDEQTLRRMATNKKQTTNSRSRARSADSAALQTPENIDAKRYATAIQNTCVFYMCCVSNLSLALSQNP